jgi:hypothetical protein
MTSMPGNAQTSTFAMGPGFRRGDERGNPARGMRHRR